MGDLVCSYPFCVCVPFKYKRGILTTIDIGKRQISDDFFFLHWGLYLYEYQVMEKIWELVCLPFSQRSDNVQNTTKNHLTGTGIFFWGEYWDEYILQETMDHHWNYHTLFLSLSSLRVYFEKWESRTAIISLKGSSYCWAWSHSMSRLLKVKCLYLHHLLTSLHNIYSSCIYKEFS